MHVRSAPSSAAGGVPGALCAPDYGTPGLLCDEMLHGLGRWLRAAGYDTALAGPGLPDRQVLAHAVAEARLLLTCDREFATRRHAGRRVVTLSARGLDSGALELRTRLGIDWLHAPFTRCLLDNAPLTPAGPEARRRLPPKARRLGGPVNRCPDCARLYWLGSHARRMRARLAAWQENSAPAGDGPIMGESTWLSA